MKYSPGQEGFSGVGSGLACSLHLEVSSEIYLAKQTGHIQKERSFLALQFVHTLSLKHNTPMDAQNIKEMKL